MAQNSDYSIEYNVLDAVMQMAMLTSPYSNIVLGSNPPDEGICMIQNGGTPERYMDKGATVNLNVLLNAKSKNQLKVLEALRSIHALLTRSLVYPNGESYQILNIETTATPTLVGQEENGQWIYGSSLNISYFWR